MVTVWGIRALPTLTNAYRNFIEVRLLLLHIHSGEQSLMRYL